MSLSPMGRMPFNPVQSAGQNFGRRPLGPGMNQRPRRPMNPGGPKQIIPQQPQEMNNPAHGLAGLSAPPMPQMGGAAPPVFNAGGFGAGPIGEAPGGPMDNPAMGLGPNKIGSGPIKPAPQVDGSYNPNPFNDMLRRQLFGY